MKFLTTHAGTVIQFLLLSRQYPNNCNICQAPFNRAGTCFLTLINRKSSMYMFYHLFLEIFPLISTWNSENWVIQKEKRTGNWITTFPYNFFKPGSSWQNQGIPYLLRDQFMESFLLIHSYPCIKKCLFVKNKDITTDTSMNWAIASNNKPQDLQR